MENTKFYSHVYDLATEENTKISEVIKGDDRRVLLYEMVVARISEKPALQEKLDELYHARLKTHRYDHDVLDDTVTEALDAYYERLALCH